MVQLYKVYAYRHPTPEEIQFGYGALHYSMFVLSRKQKPKRFRYLKNTWTVVTAKVIETEKELSLC